MLTKIEEEKESQKVEVMEQTYAEVLSSQTRYIVIAVVLVIGLLLFLLA